MGVSLKWWYPPKIKMIIFSRKTHGFVGETHHLRKPPYTYTPAFLDFKLSTLDTENDTN